MFHFVCPPMPHFIHAGQDTYPPGGRHPDRSGIGVFDLLFVASGCLYLAEEEDELNLPAGSFGILRPDLAHRTAAPCSEETHFYWLHFQTVGPWSVIPEHGARTPLAREKDHPYPPVELFSFYLPAMGKLPAPQAALEQFAELLRVREEPSAGSRWAGQQLFHALLARLQAESGASPREPHLHIAEETALYLRRHYREPLSYKRMSEALHFHPNHISLCMKKTFGCTPLEYLMRHRIELAKRLLIHTNDPIGSVAEETGFGSFPYFVRSFGKRTGMKPKEFRMLYRR